jgi:hypothetical protein
VRLFHSRLLAGFDRRTFRFTIRDLLWLTLVIGMGIGWWLNVRSLRLETDNKISVFQWAFAQDLLQFDTVADAVRFVQEESNIVDYKGPVSGSERYDVSLPSGKKVSNWQVNCLFFKAFWKFGKESIPSLIDLLGSDSEYLRVGADSELQRKAGRYDERSHSKDIEQRSAALKEWKDWWERNKHNPRLDSPRKRIYPAADWELERITH